MGQQQNNKQQSKIKPPHELSEDEKNHLRRSGRYIPPTKPTLWQKLKILFASVPNSVKNAISFKTLGQAVNASVLIGAITFIAGEQGRRDAQVYQAWQVINSAANHPGSGGRIQALEFLNSTPRRIPWFWLHWERESLSGLEAPKAYLVPSRKDIGKKGGIQLSNASLENANLQRATLDKANLQRADLRGANLQRATLDKANLQRATLDKANLQRADLRGANLQGAYLIGANLQEANLISANLQGAILETANLQRAYLIGANLQGAHLLGINLQGADLGDTNLQGANLINANLQGVNLINTNLQGVNLKAAQYTDKSTSQNICKTIVVDRYSGKNYNYPCPTIFPDNFDPKVARMELVK